MTHENESGNRVKPVAVVWPGSAHFCPRTDEIAIFCIFRLKCRFQFENFSHVVAMTQYWVSITDYMNLDESTQVTYLNDITSRFVYDLISVEILNHFLHVTWIKKVTICCCWQNTYVDDKILGKHFWPTSVSIIYLPSYSISTS